MAYVLQKHYICVPGKPPGHFDKAMIESTKKPNIFVETTSNTKNMMALFVPTGKNKTVSVIHSLGVVDGKTMGIYGTKLSAPILEPNLETK